MTDAPELAAEQESARWEAMSWRERCQEVAGERNDLAKQVIALNHRLKMREQSDLRSRDYWVRAAQKALAGDTLELRNRVDMCLAPPVAVVLSEQQEPTHD